MVVLLIVGLPAAVMIGGAAWSALMGETLSRDADRRAEGQPQ